MAENGKPDLFGGDLPEQAAPARAVVRVPRVRRAEREQVLLRPVSLDALVPADHRVRLVWAFAEALDLSPLYAAVKAVEGGPGHPPADPRVLMALWLYATIEGVGSARELARLCTEHVAYQWLCGGISVNHKTLGDFRVGHGALLERLLVNGFAALLRSGIARLERVAQDGVRVRASAGAASFRRVSSLKEARRLAEERVRRLAEEIDGDPGAASRRQAAAQRRAAAARARRVSEALAAAEQLEAARQGRAKREGRKRRDRRQGAPAAPVEPGAQAAPEARASSTDPEARVMKMADGGYRPAYNAQFATDTHSGLIAAVAVDNVGSDMGKMAAMATQLRDSYGSQPAAMLVDGGFAKLTDITTVAAAGVTVYAPVPKPRDAGRDRYAPRPEDAPAVAAWRQRMGEEAAKAIYKQRAATAELINAQARNRGLRQFLVRGTTKVKAVLLWFALAHNMARLWSLAPA